MVRLLIALYSMIFAYQGSCNLSGLVNYLSDNSATDNPAHELLDLGNTALRNNDYETAIDYYTQALTIDDTLPSAYFQRGNAYYY